MRLPPISRSHTSVLTRGRWVFAPNWRVFSRHHEYRSGQAVAVARNQSTWQTPEAASLNSPACQQSELSKLPAAKSKSHTKQRNVITPNILLTEALNVYRYPNTTQSGVKIHRLRSLALKNNTQLVVITAQWILRKASRLDPRVEDMLCSDAEWEENIRLLASKGITEGHVSHWAWTLISPDPNQGVTRFLSEPRHKPLFVLCHLLKDPQLSPYSLRGLLEYCKKWYSGQQTERDSAESFDLYSVLDPSHFNSVAESLCFQASRLEPGALPEIADLSVAYIKGISDSCQHPGKTYKAQCQVFNGVLQAVSLSPIKSPYQQVSQNWRAITILLSLSSSLERPLIIEEESYRAIRQVLLALPKTTSERDTASALSGLWPPYRILRDGMEEEAGTQEYLSRVVKAGFMMQEGGYSKEEIDVVMDVLGGIAPDGSPTIHTRANYSRHLRAEQGRWAALIRTTRNAQEAWAAFTNPPELGTRPTTEVYWELLVKLAAAPADPGHHNLPGDGREVFPFDDRNLSDFEKARTRPPSIPQVVEQMLNDGVAIQQPTLAWLLRQAPDVETALEYINHSSVDEELKTTLRQCLQEYQMPLRTLSTRFSRPIDVPREILHATIGLLCRLQPNRTKNTPDYLPKHKFYPIHHAFRLAQIGRKSALAYERAPWESIMRALGRPNIMVSNTAPQDNDIEVVTMALEVLKKAEQRGALTLDMLDSFGQTIRKAVYSSLSVLLSSTSAMLPGDGDFMSLYRAQSTELAIPNGPYVFRRPGAAHKVDGSWHKILTPVFRARLNREPLRTPCKVVRHASEKLKAAWRVLSTRDSAQRPSVDSRVMALHIYGYMRTLAAVGDLKEAVLLLCWVVRDWAPTAGADLSPANVRRLSRAVIAFRALVEPLLDESVVASLRGEIETNNEQGGPVHWPTDQEVEEYIQGDDWGSQQNLYEVVKSAAVSKQERWPSGGQKDRGVDQELEEL
ncbi:hypothetical protein LX32DRAFT_552261 [Colletotrichum zoysiae]|uniref:Prefoldin subunit n=1 Tax=Colletotrichum zoysiae TaxID=1216348 RepID=A0AAD9HSD9_9PEZI|nr:hypothetical protein LX32DRAFT_552261 [Colletotrichum zoysiae]